MAGDYEEVKLENLNGGQIGALFDRELARVLENIADENTNAKDVRSISITIKFKPEEDRGGAAVEVGANSKLASVKPSKKMVVFAFDGATVTAYQSDPKQMLLDGLKPEDSRIIPMPGKTAGER